MILRTAKAAASCSLRHQYSYKQLVPISSRLGNIHRLVVCDCRGLNSSIKMFFASDRVNAAVFFSSTMPFVSCVFVLSSCWTSMLRSGDLSVSLCTLWTRAVVPHVYINKTFTCECMWVMYLRSFCTYAVHVCEGPFHVAGGGRGGGNKSTEKGRLVGFPPWKLVFTKTQQRWRSPG